MKKTLYQFLFSVWLWALLPTIATSLLVPKLVEHYSVAIEEHTLAEHDQLAFYDLNGDGETEQIQALSGLPLNNFPIMNSKGNFFDQWNLPDKLVNGISELYFGNFDSDKFAEIYVFTVHEDSIFLNINEFLDSAGTHQERIFITKINLVKGHIDSNTRYVGLFDTNNDGKQELYFRINTGFGLWPRHCYYYDIANKVVITNERTGINFNYPFLGDLDGDHRPEIFSSMTASGNHQIPTAYTDYSAWLMVLDDRLKFKFTPVEFPGFGGALEVAEIKSPAGNSLAVAYNFRGAGTPAQQPGISLYDQNGNRIKMKTFRDMGLEGIVRFPLTQYTSGRIAVLSRDLVLLNDELDIIRSQHIPFSNENYSNIANFDINDDGADEIFLYSQKDRKALVYDLSLNFLTEIPLVADATWQTFKKVTTSGTQLFIKSGSHGYMLKFKENKLYLLGYLMYAGIYLCFVFFIALIRHVNTKQIEKRELQKQKLLTLQLQSIKSQLDPHFTFNALNSVASLLYLEDKKLAYDALNKFTRLLRQMLNDADKIYRTLEEELVFVTGYLELEKVRFGEKFSFHVEIADGVTGRELVPKMVLQTFAENAVNHGLVPRRSLGVLKIKIEKHNERLKLTIEDNGIGRQKAAGQTRSTGKGLKLNSEFYEILSRLHHRSIHQKITDLHTSIGEPCGTRVEISVPSDLELIVS